jgi:hypothetical protein
MLNMIEIIDDKGEDQVEIVEDRSELIIHQMGLYDGGDQIKTNY